LRKHQGGSRSGLSGINRPVKNLNRNPRQPNQLLSQQNRPFSEVLRWVIASDIERFGPIIQAAGVKVE
jgi:hypothetical protein